MFDPLGLFAPFSVHMRRLLKSIWTKNGQHWHKSLEPSEEEEFLKWKEQLPEVAETTIDRRYFRTAKDKWELYVFADSSEDTMCAVAYLRSKPEECSADLPFVIGKCRVAPMRHLSIPRLELQAAVMAVRLKEQIVKEHETKIHSCNFWTDSTTFCNGFIAPTVSNRCLLQTEWLRFWIQLMFHSGIMWVVLTIQLTSGHERSMLTNLREANGSLGRPGWSNERMNGLNRWI